MRFEPLGLNGAFRIEIEPRADDRGLFARTYCEEEFAAHGLPTRFVQCNTSFNTRRGTLRGMHYQADPRPEEKLVRCTRGAVYDVIVDLRPESPTFCKWEGFELSADNRRALFVPAGFGHGFQTLADGSEVFYQMSELYVADLARGVRWNDPAFGIVWPLAETIIAPRDAAFADFVP
ncbi:MAG: dTDP-4-dehydrorhamnose 3,5-epimerase [Rhodoplanes sp.]|uniref:dTDP-4-dehydrorhamnose 3,5-epimerase n=1 Tax=Rhodoplanes sp. TaxID=1968906 RepID=UPI00178D3925|nr:dTDP-4-dehydrorhamnose 3,5-epimerase [Rhodoplanes sp.]NVO17951.1 dTDP-4-dehydrorhamnose 3,5-epimerase [Rhodoplanes sp.]